jgi:hypothetical protein
VQEGFLGLHTLLGVKIQTCAQHIDKVVQFSLRRQIVFGHTACGIINTALQVPRYLLLLLNFANGDLMEVSSAP